MFLSQQHVNSRWVLEQGKKQQKTDLSAGSRGVLIAWTLSTRTDAKMHVGHLRHVCSCRLSAARRRLRVILETKSHPSGLGLSNETVLLQRRWADMNDEQPSESLARLLSHVINEVSQRIQIYSGNLLGVVDAEIIGMNHLLWSSVGIAPVRVKKPRTCPLTPSWGGKWSDDKCSTYRKTSDKRARKRVSVNPSFKTSSVLLQW